MRKEKEKACMFSRWSNDQSQFVAITMRFEYFAEDDKVFSRTVEGLVDLRLNVWYAKDNGNAEYRIPESNKRMILVFVEDGLRLDKIWMKTSEDIHSI